MRDRHDTNITYIIQTRRTYKSIIQTLVHAGVPDEELDDNGETAVHSALKSNNTLAASELFVNNNDGSRMYVWRDKNKNVSICYIWVVLCQNQVGQGQVIAQYMCDAIFSLPLIPASGATLFLYRQVSRAGTSNYTTQYMRDVIICPYP